MTIKCQEFDGSYSKLTRKVTVGPLAMWFSCEDLIAFQFGTDTLHISKNAWGARDRGRATGRHLNALDGGTKESKAARMPRKAFLEAASRIEVTYRPTD